ncbi:putative ABC transporter membrane protein [[Actinomadura] parvosata subsp. kistnae]|uniref:Transport permease protein n=1 Tax=[Actinomadura] parvosata subsp. kistnae TaxID=1909395 RepID=A0A1V0A7G0_9ACTN|nr:ABC transporter permease [Nonomuraea sp. ATCC 55076]AQZ66109.1 multidrug ABC transporter permease [Nonomuraea sp. ATCC 55076]SPL97607.1 putative ABC transporter membrane protein [Actinomadura parvosata subsp. kistnae]
MTTAVEGPLTRLHRPLADGWTVARRDLIHWANQPMTVVFGIAFPIMITLAFGYLFGGAVRVPEGADYFAFLMPGMYGMTMLFGLSATMIAVTTDASKGVTDRFRSMPMAPSAVLIGRAIADLLNSVLVLAGLLACGLAVGWRPATLSGALAAVGLLLLLRFALLWAGIYLGLLTKDPGGVVAIQTLEFPIGFLSNAFVAPSTMPGWLGAVSEWNPLSSTVAATRQLFGNPGWGGESWVAQHAILMALLWPALITTVFFTLSVRLYQRLDR